MIDKISETLGIETWRLKVAMEKGIVQIFDKPFKHMIFRRNISKIEEGTIVNLENMDVIHGYQKIKRILYLEPVIKKYFKGKIAVEEKMNGYNIRVYMYKDKIYAITRGGFICPYTTHMLRKNDEIKKFLKDFEEYYLCGEIVGKYNPYVSKEYPEEKYFGLFVFDIKRKNENTSMRIPDRNKLLEEYCIKHVKLFGIFDKNEAYEKIIRIIKYLDKENREGIVLKDPDMKIEPVKYTTTSANIETIRKGFEFPFDLAQGYMNRIIAEAFKCFELKLNEEEIKNIARKLGESILIPFVESIKKVYEKGYLSEKFMLEIDDKNLVEELEKFLRKQGIPIILKKQNSKVVFEKIYNSSYDKIKNILKNGFYF